MGYLNNATTVLDAILTKKGRELLARGQNEFRITKFALADDEVDYSLWDPGHPLGSDYYGQVIENLPLLEPTPDTNTIMRYKLVTRAVGTRKMSTLLGIESAYTVQWSSQGNEASTAGPISPTTTNVPNDGTTDPAGYSFTVLNSSIAYLTSPSNDGGAGGGGAINYTASTQNISQTVFGNSCTIHPKAINDPNGAADPTTTIIVTGLSYGATFASTVTVGYTDES